MLIYVFEKFYINWDKSARSADTELIQLLHIYYLIQSFQFTIYVDYFLITASYLVQISYKYTLRAYNMKLTFISIGE